VINVVAIIPARGGSKGLPDKNIKFLAGKPMIAWTIEAALSCKVIERVFVSTEDRDIASIAQKYGAEAPFLRPKKLASDTSSSVDVAIHTLQWLEESEHFKPDFLLLLQPTSPLRTAKDIHETIELQARHNADAIISVCQTPHPPHWIMRFASDGSLVPYFGTPEVSRRQDAKPAYQLNGANYLVRTEILVNQKTFFPKNTFGYIMPFNRSIDIDTAWDFQLADLILKETYAAK
jgi:N-acylneuraminate cytidylyltransferase/CMP-N,N'-diacetyllegionaminic acid synthase